MNAAQKLLLAGLCAVPVLAAAQTSNPTLPPLGNSWPTYSGDYSGRRYSSLTQIDRSNVKHLTLAWAARLKPKRTILTHMTSELDYDTLVRELPPGVEPAYDGMQVNFT